MKQGNLDSILGVNPKELTKQIGSLKQEYQTYGPKDPFNLKFKDVGTSEDRQNENPLLRPNYELKTPELSASKNLNQQHPSMSTHITEHNPKPIFTNIHHPQSSKQMLDDNLPSQTESQILKPLQNLSEL
jgi:hypothetical protein